jgi:hypothetical protein
VPDLVVAHVAHPTFAGRGRRTSRDGVAGRARAWAR